MNISFRFAALSLTCALALSLSRAANAQNNSNNTPLVMGYYPSYDTQIAAQEIHPNRFTDVIYSFATADKNGDFVPASCAQFPDFVQTVHAKNLRAILALSGGGNGADFAKMANDDQKRAAFVAAIGQLIRQTGADGVALDWEPDEAQNKAITTQLIRELHDATKAANPAAQLILVVGSGAWSGRSFDGAAVKDWVDTLQVMTYDFHGEWSVAGHHTNLFASGADEPDDGFNYPDSLRYWRDVQGFPASKILMGIAGYGRGFRAPKWGVKASGESQYPYIAYSQIVKLIGQGWTRKWDAQAHAPWLLSADKTERISYDDVRSVADKAVWMKRNGLAGFFIWELTQEEVGGDNVLTAAALQAWKNAPALEPGN